MKKTIRVMMAASAAILLLGGMYLLIKDDAAQKRSESKLEPYRPSVSVQSALDYTDTEPTAATETGDAELLATVFTGETVICETTATSETLTFTLTPEVCEELMEQAGGTSNGLSRCHRLAVYPRYKHQLPDYAG